MSAQAGDSGGDLRHFYGSTHARLEVIGGTAALALAVMFYSGVVINNVLLVAGL